MIAADKDSYLAARRALFSARELLDDALGPARWTTRALARDTLGCEVEPTSMYAVAWDLRGAVIRGAGNPRTAVAAVCFLVMVAVRRGARDSFSVPSLTILNDSSTWEQVLDALDEAIGYVDVVLRRLPVPVV